MSNFEELTEEKLEKLKIFCTNNMQQSAQIISSMTGQKIKMSVAEIKVIPLSDTVGFISEKDEYVVGIYCKIIGEITGGFLITLSEKNAKNLCNIILTKSWDNNGKEKSFSEMEKSLLTEVGNIISASFVCSLAKVLDKSIFISVPKYAFDMVGAVVDSILSEFAQLDDYALVMKFVLTDENEHIRCKFFILPQPGALQVIIDKI